MAAIAVEKVTKRFPDGTEYSAGDVIVNDDGTEISGTIAPDESRQSGQGVLRVKNPAPNAGYGDSDPLDFYGPGTICVHL